VSRAAGEVAGEHEALTDRRDGWSGVTATERAGWGWGHLGSLLDLVADGSR